MVKSDQKETRDGVQLRGYCRHVNDCQRFTKLGIFFDHLRHYEVIKNTQYGHSPFTAQW
jgi:hypothetical protein